jgi:hypothetical protein
MPIEHEGLVGLLVLENEPDRGSYLCKLGEAKRRLGKRGREARGDEQGIALAKR